MLETLARAHCCGRTFEQLPVLENHWQAAHCWEFRSCQLMKLRCWPLVSPLGVSRRSTKPRPHSPDYGLYRETLVQLRVMVRQALAQYMSGIALGSCRKSSIRYICSEPEQLSQSETRTGEAKSGEQHALPFFADNRRSFWCPSEDDLLLASSARRLDKRDVRVTMALGMKWQPAWQRLFGANSCRKTCALRRSPRQPL